MHASVFDQISFFCPACRRSGPEKILQFPLRIAGVFQQECDHIVEGILECSGDNCDRTYPIIEGVPVLLKDVRGWWHTAKNEYLGEWGRSPEIREFFKSLGSEKDEALGLRSRLGSTIEFHYDTPVDTPPLLSGMANPGAFWNTAMEMARPAGGEKYRCALDLGCAAGRFTHELSDMSDLSVGIDTNFSLLSFAAALHRHGHADWARRIRGRWFRKSVITALPRNNICFLVADALDPPFAAATFDIVVGLNLLDSIRLPLMLLGQMDALLHDAGTLMLSAPYEWRPDISEISEWLEDKKRKAPEVVRCILEGNLYGETGFHYKILREDDQIPYVLRNHDRYWSLFFVHMVLAKKAVGKK